ncbi:Endonuclease/exonuclease/phosphatase [Xylariomycetidae sp. FL2044]|nr:Endonuclease/exonuclease/phosphatase [Xylariomycetidae sp. FL2044]
MTNIVCWIWRTHHNYLVSTTPDEGIAMSFLSSIRTRYLSWSHSTPLPDIPDAGSPVFQHWHIFDRSAAKWVPVQLNPPNAQQQQQQQQQQSSNGTSRLEGIISKLQQMISHDDGPDIVFFQEVSRKALAYLLRHAWAREFWISSEANETDWAAGAGGVLPFATMTLLSRARFAAGPSSSSSSNSTSSSGSAPSAQLSNTTAVHNDDGSFCFGLGPVWRVKYPSRFGRDALCCDIFFCDDISTARRQRIRLINVHLDSLPIQPNQRPRQVAIAAALVRAAGVGRGVVAGDWNPVTEGDATLAEKNGLIDAWECLCPGEDGFTWGLDGRGDPFPAARLDRVAVLGLRLVDIRVVHPETLTVTDTGLAVGEDNREEDVPWSDHSGLVCTFSVSGATGSS